MGKLGTFGKFKGRIMFYILSANRQDILNIRVSFEKTLKNMGCVQNILVIKPKTYSFVVFQVRYFFTLFIFSTSLLVVLFCWLIFIK